MKHARPDYDVIQAPVDIIPADEPVFLLRAKDVTAPRVVDFWASEAEEHGADRDIIDKARGQAQRMRDWQSCNGAKVPDMPKELE